MKKIAKLLMGFTMALTFVTSASADGGERLQPPSDLVIVKPMDGGERI